MRNIVDELKPPFVRQRGALEETGAAVREASNEYLGRRLVAKLKFPVAAPLKAKLIYKRRRQRRRQPRIEALNPDIIRSVSTNVPKHQRRLNAVQASGIQVVVGERSEIGLINIPIDFSKAQILIGVSRQRISGAASWKS